MVVLSKLRRSLSNKTQWVLNFSCIWWATCPMNGPQWHFFLFLFFFGNSKGGYITKHDSINPRSNSNTSSKGCNGEDENPIRWVRVGYLNINHSVIWIQPGISGINKLDGEVKRSLQNKSNTSLSEILTLYHRQTFGSMSNPFLNCVQKYASCKCVTFHHWIGSLEQCRWCD